MSSSTEERNKKRKTSPFLAVILLLVIIAASVILCSNKPKDSKINSLAALAFLMILALMSVVTFTPMDNLDAHKDDYLMALGEFLTGNPKVDGCCLYPEQAICKKYTPEQIQQGCCGKGFSGKKVTFGSEQHFNADCSKCNN